MARPRTLLLLPLAALALAGAACSNSGNSTADNQASATTAPPATTSQPTPTTSASPPATVAVSGPSPAGTWGTKPKVTLPSGPLPTQLAVADLITGTGATAQAGQTVNVQYVGVLASDGTQFDASWDHGQPFTFTLGAGQVISGWDQGVAGMKVGGRRELVIPPSLGYGASGQGTIPANATLIFIVDLLSAG